MTSRSFLVFGPRPSVLGTGVLAGLVALFLCSTNGRARAFATQGANAA